MPWTGLLKSLLLLISLRARRRLVGGHRLRGICLSLFCTVPASHSYRSQLRIILLSTTTKGDQHQHTLPCSQRAITLAAPREEIPAAAHIAAICSLQSAERTVSARPAGIYSECPIPLLLLPVSERRRHKSHQSRERTSRSHGCRVQVYMIIRTIIEQPRTGLYYSHREYRR